MAYQEFVSDPKNGLDVKRAYREVFSTKQGILVFAHMLSELGYFDTVIEGERALGRQDYARRLLWLVGVHDERNILAFVNKLFELPLYSGEKNLGSTS